MPVRVACRCASPSSAFALFIALAAGCGDDAPAPPRDASVFDAGARDLAVEDAAPGDDAATDAGDADAGATDAGARSCGMARPEIGAVRGTEGLVIARDGTVYYSQRGGVGRLAPDGTNDAAWLRIPGTTTIWGLALDAANARIFVASPGDGTLYAADVTSPSAMALATGLGAPNGLTLGLDGALYASDFDTGTIFRIDATSGAKSTVTTSTIDSANGLAFAPGDPATLYALSYARGTLLALTLDAAHVETARRTVARSLGNPDGVTLAADGRFYVTDNGGGRVLRLEADGTGATVISTSSIGAAANLSFGVGPLDCHDLYVASSGALARLAVPDATAAPVPWQ
jgi:sugar lactone lactonase YvrE